MRSLSHVDSTPSLKEKTDFLLHPDTYGDTSTVEVIETHMSLVFLTDRFVFKLKKPVSFPFLDFSTPLARQKYCNEEVRINRPLGGDTYLSVLAITSVNGHLSLNGKGDPVDWLVKMKRLPAEQMLHHAIRANSVDPDALHAAAEKLADFYIGSHSLYPDTDGFRRALIQDIEHSSSDLLRNSFKLNKSVVLGIETELLHFLIKHEDLFDTRIGEGRVVDAHGDLRPEHICLTRIPVIIDRLEFNPGLRIMDIAEELSFLAMECDVLGANAVGDVFMNVYKAESGDEIPPPLIRFYKARRAFLRAKLSINHLLERRYLADRAKWQTRCEAYLGVAVAYCHQK